MGDAGEIVEIFDLIQGDIFVSAMLFRVPGDWLRMSRKNGEDHQEEETFEEEAGFHRRERD